MCHMIFILFYKKPKLLDMAVCSRNCRQDLPLRLPYTESLKRGECHASFLAAATKYRRFNSAVPVVSLFAYPWGRHRITKQRLLFFFFFWHSRVVCIKTKALTSYTIPLQSAFGSTFQYWFFQYGLKSIYNKPKFQPFWFFFFFFTSVYFFIFFILSFFFFLPFTFWHHHHTLFCLLDIIDHEGPAFARFFPAVTTPCAALAVCHHTGYFSRQNKSTLIYFACFKYNHTHAGSEGQFRISVLPDD